MKQFEPKNFVADGSAWNVYGGGVVWPDEIAKRVFGREPEYGNLFFYMFRKFGPPTWPVDEYKEAGRWVLTTPDSDIGLSVVPCPSGLHFGYMVKKNLNIFENSARIEKAIAESMAGLLVPTYVRDIYVNALGIVDDIGDLE